MTNRTLLLFIFCLTFTALLIAQQPSPQRGLWVTAYQEPQVLASAEEMDKLIAFARQARIQTLYVQLYRGGKAWFPSKTADDLAFQGNLKKVGEDPFRLLIKKAHAAGLEVFAWTSLLSLATNDEALILKKYGSSVLTRNLKSKGTLKDYQIDNQYFLEPGDLRVRNFLSKIVREIVTAYPEMNGIQFDYARYPDKDPHYGYTGMNARRFKNAAGQFFIDEESRVWKNWKRRQVNELVQLLSYHARKIRPGIKVAASVLAPYSRAYHEAYQEWNQWLDQNWLDFVIVMSYSPKSERVQTLITDAQKRVKDPKKLLIGIWTEQKEKVKDLSEFSKQMEICEQTSQAGCVVLDYESFHKNTALTAALTQAEV